MENVSSFEVIEMTDTALAVAAGTLGSQSDRLCSADFWGGEADGLRNMFQLFDDCLTKHAIIPAPCAHAAARADRPPAKL